MPDKMHLGMKNLVAKSEKKREDFDPNRCWLLQVSLTGQKFYWADDQDGGRFGQIDVGMKFNDVYSVEEIKTDDGIEPKVTRHPAFIMAATGFTMDYVKKPSWWEKRPKDEPSKLIGISQ